MNASIYEKNSKCFPYFPITYTYHSSQQPIILCVHKEYILSVCKPRPQHHHLPQLIKNKSGAIGYSIDPKSSLVCPSLSSTLRLFTWLFFWGFCTCLHERAVQLFKIWKTKTREIFSFFQVRRSLSFIQFKFHLLLAFHTTACGKCLSAHLTTFSPTLLASWPVGCGFGFSWSVMLLVFP